MYLKFSRTLPRFSFFLQIFHWIFLAYYLILWRKSMFAYNFHRSYLKFGQILLIFSLYFRFSPILFLTKFLRILLKISTRFNLNFFKSYWKLAQILLVIYTKFSKVFWKFIWRFQNLLRFFLHLKKNVLKFLS